MILMSNTGRIHNTFTVSSVSSSYIFLLVKRMMEELGKLSDIVLDQPLVGVLRCFYSGDAGISNQCPERSLPIPLQFL